MNKLVAFTVSMSLLLSASGCTTTHTTLLNDYRDARHPGIERVLLTDGSIVEFDSAPGKAGIYRDKEVTGTEKQSRKTIHIASNRIRVVTYTEEDIGKSLILSGGVAMAAAIVVYGVMAVTRVASWEKR